jgi:hypothetical protein
MKIRVSNSLFVILVSAVLWQPVSAAADSYDPPARVARLSYSRGSVSFQPAGDSEWVDAVLNLPIVTGDNLWAGENSRAEVRIGSKAIRLDHDTEISFPTITDHRIQLTACFQYVACHAASDASRNAMGKRSSHGRAPGLLES